METTVQGRKASGPLSDPVTAELAAYNHAFCELELPWRWDEETLAQLKSVAGDRGIVGAYVERSQAHLLRAYEKRFLEELVHSARERYQETLSAAP
ncbi:MAG TPA: hypothetical protein VKT54_08130 [Steroidobacteraceae bacterium]|nr:hypothetical protein [Steroidobacteraceae bacterium]